MTKRSAERVEFLEGILSTALEGGVGYWSQASDIQRSGDYPDGQWQYVSCKLWEWADGDDSCSVEGAGDKDGRCQGHLVDLDVIARGVSGLIARKKPHPYRDRKLLAKASRENWAGDVDSAIADDIVQFGVFGAMIYG